MNVAGIDAHATYLVVAIVSKTGELVHAPTRIANSNASKLLELLGRFRPIEAVVETSPAWPWLYDLLTGHDFGFVLAHAKRLRIIAESNYKRDEVDAELLARMRLAGLIPYVHAKDIETREQATLIRHRARLVRLRTGAVSRIHAELHGVGLYLGRGRLLTRAGRQWIREHAWPLFGPEQQRLVRTHWALIRTLSSMIQRLDREIERVGAELPAVALLQAVPGIGSYRGLLIATEVLPIERFATPEKLVGYAGLAPRSAHSRLRPTRLGHIPAGANRWLRNAFVQGVISLVRHAPDSWLSRYYDAHKKRLGWQTARIAAARIAAARKLARATHAMLRTGEAWRDKLDSPSGERRELQGPHVALTTPVS